MTDPKDAARLFFKLHNGFPEHPKAMELSDKAFRQLIEAWCYCSRNLNDGQLSKAQFLKLFSAKSRKEVVTVGFVKESGFGYEMHDYLLHQQSAEEVESRRIARKLAGSKGGKTRASNQANAKQVLKQTGSKVQADIDTDIDVDKRLTTNTLSDAVASDGDQLPVQFDIPAQEPAAPAAVVYPADFLLFWDVYPLKNAKRGALDAWRAARRNASVSEILVGAKRYAEDPNRDPGFTANPAKWLKDGRWDDAPLPARRGQQQFKTAAERKLEQADQLIAHYAAQEGYDLTGRKELTT
jgi:hypothetical protein